MTKAEEDGRSLFCHSGFAINSSFALGFRNYCNPGMPSPPVILVISDCASALPCSTAC